MAAPNASDPKALRTRALVVGAFVACIAAATLVVMAIDKIFFVGITGSAELSWFSLPARAFLMVPIGILALLALPFSLWGVTQVVLDPTGGLFCGASGEPTFSGFGEMIRMAGVPVVGFCATLLALVALRRPLRVAAYVALGVGVLASAVAAWVVRVRQLEFMTSTCGVVMAPHLS